MGRQTNVKNVFEKERKNEGERKEARRRGRPVEAMEGPTMAVSLYSVYAAAAHFILTKQSE